MCFAASTAGEAGIVCSNVSSCCCLDFPTAQLGNFLYNYPPLVFHWRSWHTVLLCPGQWGGASARIVCLFVGEQSAVAPIPGLPLASPCWAPCCVVVVVRDGPQQAATAAPVILIIPVWLYPATRYHRFAQYSTLHTKWHSLLKLLDYNIQRASHLLNHSLLKPSLKSVVIVFQKYFPSSEAG